MKWKKENNKDKFPTSRNDEEGEEVKKEQEEPEQDTSEKETK